MDQAFLNWIYGGVMAALGWFAKALWDADKELRSDLSKLREELPQRYVLKDDIDKRFDRIDKLLDQIWTELKGKVDK